MRRLASAWRSCSIEEQLKFLRWAVTESGCESGRQFVGWVLAGVVDTLVEDTAGQSADP